MQEDVMMCISWNPMISTMKTSLHLVIYIVSMYYYMCMHAYVCISLKEDSRDILHYVMLCISCSSK